MASNLKFQKKTENGFILKKIEFSDKGRDYSFCEKVQMLTKETLLNMLSTVGFSLDAIYGDYGLQTFNEHSPRLIIFAKKQAF